MKSQFYYKGIFFIRFRLTGKIISFFRKLLYRLYGLQIGKGTNLPKSFFTWPHQVAIGNHCRLEHDIFFKVDGIGDKGIVIRIQDRVFIGANCEFNIRQGIQIGNDCLIASGCKFIDHDHGTGLNQLMRLQPGTEGKILIGNNVWLGVNVTVLKGVTINEGAIVAASAVVTQSILPNEIWGGVPAKKIGERK